MVKDMVRCFLIAFAFLVILSDPLAAKCGKLCNENWWKTATETDLIAEIGVTGNANLKDDYGDTPLHWASTPKENIATTTALRLLLSTGASLDARNIYGMTPLHSACKANSLEAISVLLSAGADIIALSEDGSAPLHFVGPQVNIQTVELLLSYGANGMARNLESSTPLHRFARFGRLDAVRLLVSAGADVMARNDAGQTPLHRANWNTTTFLIDAGSEVDARDNRGRTPLHFSAAFVKEGFKTSKSLLDRGASVSPRDENGSTPLMIAAQFSDSEEVLKLLLDSGADIMATDGSELMRTALQLGITSCLGECNLSKLTTLFEASKDKFSISYLSLLLFNAVYINDFSVRSLIGLGAEVTIIDKFGNTPLHKASDCVLGSYLCKAGVIQTLLDAGADPNLKNNGGKSPWDLAQNNKNLKGTKDYWALNDRRFE